MCAGADDSVTDLSTRIRRKPVPVYQDGELTGHTQRRQVKHSGSNKVKALQLLQANTITGAATPSRSNKFVLKAWREDQNHDHVTFVGQGESIVDTDVFNLSRDLDLTLLSPEGTSPETSCQGPLSTASTGLDLTLDSPSTSTPPRSQIHSAQTTPSDSSKRKRVSLAPIVVETCPTPQGTVRVGTDSRERSLVLPIAFNESSDEDEEVLADTTVNSDLILSEAGWFRSGLQASSPSATAEPTTHPSLASSISFPSHMSLSSVLDSQIDPPLTSRRSSLASCTPTQTRPVTPSKECFCFESSSGHVAQAPVQFEERRRPSRDLRAQPSVATLFSWDLAHLPAPKTPREQPYRVKLMSLLLPTIALGGGKGSGRYGDVYGPLERRSTFKTPAARIERSSLLGSVSEETTTCVPKLSRARSVSRQSSDFVRGVSRRSSLLIKSVGLRSKEELVPEAEEESLQDWVKVVLQ
ncbi:hypothetical protein ACM66B_003034 [Microbotryomycetes sp. NB124-2]